MCWARMCRKVHGVLKLSELDFQCCRVCRTTRLPAHQTRFIPLAPTFMIKALRRVLELASKTVDFEPPTAAALQLVCLTSSGDLRSAINSIQMLCTHTAVQAAKGRKRKNNTKEAGGRKTAVVGKDARGWVKSKLDIPDDIRAV